MEKRQKRTETATFAGGCFWCSESDFKKHEGIIEAVAGYTGGHKGNPTYEDVSTGLSGHLEAVRIRFDPDIIPYERLLDIFWKHIDPTDANGQFVDRGSQYQTAIFYHNEKQKVLAEASKTALSRSGRFSKAIVTRIMPCEEFYEAEAWHQNYYKKNPIRYKFYLSNSGRDQFRQRVWRDTAEKRNVEAAIKSKR